MGVLAPEAVFLSAPKLRRGQKFDWLYEVVVKTRALETSLRNTVRLPDIVWDRLATEEDHEKRAALICLLTAAAALQGAANWVGDPGGGWFCLPPWNRWQLGASE